MSEPAFVSGLELSRRFHREEVLWGDFPGALHAQIQDPAVLRIAERWPTGGVDHLRDLGWHPGSRGRLLRLLD